MKVYNLVEIKRVGDGMIPVSILDSNDSHLALLLKSGVDVRGLSDRTYYHMINGKECVVLTSEFYPHDLCDIDTGICTNSNGFIDLICCIGAYEAKGRPFPIT